LKVLVTDAYERKSLAALRHLGERGVWTAAGGAKRWGQALFSKHCRERVLYPNPVQEPEAFVAFMLEYLAENRFDCVLPMSCYTTILFARHKDDFSRLTNLAVPDHALLQRVRDKAEIVKVARGLGIGAPRTWQPADEDEARDLAGRISYPSVVKYRRGTGSMGIRYAHSPRELVDYYRTPAHDTDIVFDDPRPIVQEYIPGRVTDVSFLCNRGRPRAAEVHTRTMTWPPSGGWGVTYLTVDAPDLKAKAFRLLEEVGWHGPGLVEFKVDSRTGEEKLMEINTRFGGGLDVSREAGVDFAWLTVKMAVEGDVEPVWDYRVGMRYRFLGSQLKCVLAGGNRLQKFLEYVTPQRGVRHELRLSDPLPHLANVAAALYLPLRAAAGRFIDGAQRAAGRKAPPER